MIVTAVTAPSPTSLGLEEIMNISATSNWLQLLAYKQRENATGKLWGLF
jgi:hypothetical protein